MRKTLQGTLTALITPFNRHGGIDLDRLKQNIDFQRASGCGVLPVGTTGESPTLSWDEHIELVRQTVNMVNYRTFVLAGTGSNSTHEALQSSKLAIIDGADGLLLVECYYNKPASSQLRKNYHAVIASVALRLDPEVWIVPYVIPGRTCCKLEPVDLALLAEQYPNVRAVKEATGDLDNMAETRRLLGPNFTIMSGDDGLIAQMMMNENIKGNGVISVMSNIIPGAIVEMVNAFLAGERQLGIKLHEKLKPLFNLVTVKVESTRIFRGEHIKVEDKFPNPCAIKTIMAGLDIDSGFMREPMGRMSITAVQKVRDALVQVWQQNPEVFQPLADHYGINVEARLIDGDFWAGLAV